jgi:hypothetical protein
MVIPNSHLARGNPIVLVPRPRPRTERGALLTELVIAIALMAIVVLPLAFGFAKEQKLCRAYYFQAVAMEIVDGEIELLKAGAWKNIPEGTGNYSMRAESAANLPPGRFLLTRKDRFLRLEWVPDKLGKGGRVVRELEVP